MIHVLDSTFESEVINSDKPVLVDFWATWCGPCRMVAPIIEELSEDYKDKVKFAKVDVDQNPVISNTLKVASIPTVMIFKGGRVVDTLVGFRPKDAFKQIIDRNL